MTNRVHAASRRLNNKSPRSIECVKRFGLKVVWFFSESTEEIERYNLIIDRAAAKYAVAIFKCYFVYQIPFVIALKLSSNSKPRTVTTRMPIMTKFHPFTYKSAAWSFLPPKTIAGPHNLQHVLLMKTSPCREYTSAFSLSLMFIRLIGSLKAPFNLAFVSQHIPPPSRTWSLEAAACYVDWFGCLLINFRLAQRNTWGFAERVKPTVSRLYAGL